jgi:CRP-like cAMP-binding protein
MEKLSVEQFSEILDPAGLNEGSIFGALSEDATRFLLDNGLIFSVAAGEVVFSAGDSGDSFFVVCEGALDFYKHHEGRRVNTRSVGHGGELGFVAMIALQPHSGDAIAATDSILLEISSLLFSKLHEQYPQDFGLITLNLSRDMARVINQLGNALVETIAPADSAPSLRLKSG